MSREPVYKTYIDWHGHGGLSSGLSNWYQDSNEATLEMSYEQALRDDHSFKATSTAGGSRFWRPIKLPQGTETTVTVWVYLPSASTATSVQLSLWSNVLVADSIMYDSVSTSLQDQWVPLALVFDGLNHTGSTIWDKWLIEMEISGAAGSYCYLGWSQAVNEDDDVSCEILGTRVVPEIVYGRDAAQELAAVRPGEVEIALKNVSGRYTPANTSSPLYGLLEPNRHILITAEHGGQVYSMFNGYTQDYTLVGKAHDQSVSVPCVDTLSRLNELDVSTELYESLRTGDAIKAILDVSGFYSAVADIPYLDADTATRFDPYIDSGASTLRWWEFTGKALEGIQGVNQAEGPPAIYYIGPSNQVVFKDRHHRVRANYDSTPAYTVVACPEQITDPDTQFVIEAGSSPDYGQSTLYNRVRATGVVSNLAKEISIVWTDPEPTHTFNGELTLTADIEGFIDGQPLTRGQLVTTENLGPEETNFVVGIEPEDADYVVRSGSVTVTSFATSGSRVRITFVAAGVSTISDVKFRARAVTRDETSSEVDDVGSQTAYGRVKTYEYEGQAISANDAYDIARWILKKNSSTRPRVTYTIKNVSEAATTKILRTGLSGVVGVDNTTWYIDAPFTVESIQHSLDSLGKDHELTVSAEAVDPVGYQNPTLTFDDTSVGFDIGVFAEFAHTSFVFGAADQGFGEGAFGFNAYTDTPFIIGSSELDSTDELWY